MTAATPARRVTVLDGYYSSGDHECFCFDKWDGPDAYVEAFPFDSHEPERTDAVIAAQHTNRVYPDDLLPDDIRFQHRYGRWTITVEFEPMEEPHA